MIALVDRKVAPMIHLIGRQNAVKCSLGVLYLPFSKKNTTNQMLVKFHHVLMIMVGKNQGGGKLKCL
jgi:hypothetical protein